MNSPAEAPLTAFARLDPHARPRLRGWLHAYAFGVAVVCGVVLCSLAGAYGDRSALLACLVYSPRPCAGSSA